MKRLDYISWKDYFMNIAILSSMRSKDPSTQVGCVIVDKQNRIVGTGYNGFPIGCSDDEFPWDKHSENELDNKYLYVCHAEINAILNSNTPTENCIMYTTLFPCCDCAKMIIQSGISKIYYISKKDDIKTIASERMFNSVGIDYESFDGYINKY